MLVTIGVILARRSMYAILNLILLFVLVAFIVISLKVDFIGLIFIIVYVGAIATLFLFIIMMLGGEE
jgi:NADH:ubiquinone oxidoreductase subunit 6 (subunit J)